MMMMENRSDLFPTDMELRSDLYYKNLFADHDWLDAEIAQFVITLFYKGLKCFLCYLFFPRRLNLCLNAVIDCDLCLLPLYEPLAIGNNIVSDHG